MKSADGPNVELLAVERLIVAPASDGAKTIVSAPLPVWPRSVVASAFAAATASRNVTSPLPDVVSSAAELTVRVAAPAAVTSPDRMRINAAIHGDRRTTHIQVLLPGA